MQTPRRGNYSRFHPHKVGAFLTVLTIIILISFPPAEGAVITEWNVPGGTSSFPQYLTVDSASNVWFSEFGSDEIGKLAYGSFTEYSLSAGSRPIGIVFRDDQIWFTESVSNKIGKMGTGGGLVTEYLVGDPATYGSMELWGIAYQNSTRIWFASSAKSRIGLLNLTTPTAINVTYWVLPGFSSSPSSSPRGIVYSPSTGAWFVDYNLHRIGNIPDPLTGVIREWQLPDSSFPFDIALDSLGNIWFTESGRNRIGMLNPSTNEITEYQIPTSNSEPYGIAVDYSNRVWFTEHAANKIGRYAPGINAITEFSRSTSGAPWGITADYNGALPIWFSDGVWNRVGRLSPYDGLTTVIGESLSSASTTSTTTRASTITLKKDASSGYYNTTVLTEATGASQTQTGTTSTQYTVTEVITLVQTTSFQVSTGLTTTTSETTVLTTVTGTSTSYITTITTTGTTTSFATFTSYIATTSATATSTRTLTSFTTRFETTTSPSSVIVVPGFTEASILAGLLLGTTFLLLCHRIIRIGVKSYISK